MFNLQIEAIAYFFDLIRCAVRAANLRIRQDDPLAHDARETSQREGTHHWRWHRQFHECRRHLQGHHYRPAGVQAEADRSQNFDIRETRRSQLPGRSETHARSRTDVG